MDIRERLERHEINTRIDKMTIEIEEIRTRIAKMALESEQLNLSNKKLYVETIFYPLVVLGGLASLIGLLFKFFS